MKKIGSMLLLAVFCVAIMSIAAAEVESDKGGYVLMNIPYDKFYESEVTVNEGLDAVSSATFNKPRTGTLAG